MYVIHSSKIGENQVKKQRYKKCHQLQFFVNFIDQLTMIYYYLK